jgi:hypothetical protein
MELDRLAPLPVTRPRHMPPPACRREGCSAPVFDGLGLCFEHGLRYLLWLELRVDLERADLADSPYASYADVDDASPLARVLDVVAFLFTPRPFS